MSCEVFELSWAPILTNIGEAHACGWYERDPSDGDTPWAIDHPSAPLPASACGGLFTVDGSSPHGHD